MTCSGVRNMVAVPVGADSLLPDVPILDLPTSNRCNPAWDNGLHGMWRGQRISGVWGDFVSASTLKIFSQAIDH